MYNTLRYSILIVNDNENNLFTLRTIISEYMNENIIEADSGENALKILIKEEIDIIVLDVQMPGLDGFETAAFIKQRKKTESIPIIFLTAAYNSKEFEEKGYRVGVVDYLIKSVNEQLEIVAMMKESSIRMMSLLKNLIGLTSLETDKTEIQILPFKYVLTKGPNAYYN
jgi:response regulator RpfG family c-di-GMP phosphodiesterase